METLKLYKSIEEVKKDVDQGIKVYANSFSYLVIKSKNDYLVKCGCTNRCVGLTYMDGITSDFKPSQFFSV